MKPSKFIVSACRSCQYYQIEGRRGGMCQVLGVPVQGRWKACSLAQPVFASAWELKALVWSDKANLLPTTNQIVALERVEVTSEERVDIALG